MAGEVAAALVARPHAREAVAVAYLTPPTAFAQAESYLVAVDCVFCAGGSTWIDPDLSAAR